MRNIDLNSWNGALTTLLGLVIVSVVAVGIRLLLMQTIQRRRERENRQINERLRTLIVSLCLVHGGVPMTLTGAVEATTLGGATQTIARGPVAAFNAIKQLGSNGNGFFRPNSAHPLENPTFWTNVISNVCILLIPVASVWMFGRIAKRLPHSHVVFAVMLLLLVGLLVIHPGVRIRLNDKLCCFTGQILSLTAKNNLRAAVIASATSSPFHPVDHP